jgi:hypothetical protein
MGRFDFPTIFNAKFFIGGASTSQVASSNDGNLSVMLPIKKKTPTP